MDTCNIYKIINKINNKIYVGQTWNTLDWRFKKHCTTRRCPKLRNAINKYGKDNFIIELIGMCYTQEDADNMESYFIERFDCIKNGYNLTTGGSTGKHLEETKKKISLKNSGSGNGMYGKKFSDDHRKKLKIGQKNRKIKSPRTINQYTNEQAIEMKNMYESGLSFNKIGKIFQCSHSTVHKYVRGLK